MAYQKKLVYFVAAFCLIGIHVFGAPNPKTVVNAGDNEVVLGSTANAGVEASVGTDGNASPTPHSPIHGLRKTGPNLYNDIFNIPTSILGAVSRLLSNGGSGVGNAFASVGGAHGGQKQSGIGGGGLGSRIGGGGDGGIGASAGVGNFGLGASAGVGTGGVGASAGVGTGGVGASAGVGTGGAGGQPAGQGFFNDIFNIPITALNAVNQLLNNNQKTSG